MKLSIIFLVICSSAVSYALPKTKIQQLSKSSEWINLLHYKKLYLGVYLIVLVMTLFLFPKRSKFVVLGTFRIHPNIKFER